MLGKRYELDGKPGIVLSEIQEEARREFFEDLQKDDSIYEYEKYLCECGAGEECFEVLAEKDRYGLPVRTVICRECGLVMTNPRMTQASYDNFYANVFGRMYRGDAGVGDIEERFKKRRTAGGKICEFVETYCETKIHNVLEIGCAAGGILSFFQERGYEVTGIDLDGDYLEFGRTQGLDLRLGHSSKLLEEERKYDLIILSHVFEHFLDIEQEMAVVRELLSENGMVYIEVPGIKFVERGSYGSNFLAYLQNAHVRGFSLGTLCNVMKKYGFDLHVGDESIRSLFHYTGDNKSLIDNYYEDVLQSVMRAEIQHLSRYINSKLE